MKNSLLLIIASSLIMINTAIFASNLTQIPIENEIINNQIIDNIELENPIYANPNSGDVYLINSDEFSGYGYEKSFTCSKENGNTLNIYVKNNSSVPISFIVNGVSKTVEANSDLTRTWSNPKGKFTVKVSNSTGDKLDILVNARQFNK